MQKADQTEPPTTTQDPDSFAKTDCPHQNSLKSEEIISNLFKGLHPTPCNQCENKEENWMCLECYIVACSGLHNSHMYQHSQETGHNLTINLTNSSYWCYACNSYVESSELTRITGIYSKLKFPEAQSKIGIISALAQMFGNISLQPDSDKTPPQFTREDLIQGLKKRDFMRVVLLTGAGISVSAGIPDFRSPKTGLYDNLSAYNLPYPEAVFDIKYFREKPEAFYKLSKDLFKGDPKPTISHYFIKALEEESLLYYNFTQNIDGLEIKAGLDEGSIIEAHGHYRSAHCVECKKEKPIGEFFKSMEEEKVLVCNCGGFVKPDITFFGERMPERFFKLADEVDNADLVIIMGTSLKVHPFASLATLISEEVPIVYVNRENNSITRKGNFLFLEGDIDEQVTKLVEDLGWKEKIEELKLKSKETK